MIPKPKRCRKLVILRLEHPDDIGKDGGSNPPDNLFCVVAQLKNTGCFLPFFKNIMKDAVGG
jgi:hypothetical protein